MTLRAINTFVGAFFHMLHPFLILLALTPTVATAQWTEQDVNFSAPGFEVFSMDAVDQNTAWALAGDYQTFGAIQEFARTTDGGTTWVASIVPGATGLTASCVSALSANMAWVAYGDPTNIVRQSKIFKTTDGGATWTYQNTAFPDSGGGSFCDVVHLFDANNGVAIGDPHGGYYEIYTTTNGGTNWIRVPEANIPPPLFGEFGLVPGPSFCALVNTVWFGTNRGRVFRSTNRGTTWTAAATGVGVGASIDDVAFRDANNGLAAALDFPIGPASVGRTTDGGITWTVLLPPPMLSPILLAAVPGSPAYVMTSLETLGGGLGSAYTLNDGASWTTIDALSHGAVDFVSPNVGWSGGVTRITVGQRSTPTSRTLQAKAITPIDAPGTGRGATNKALLRRLAAAGDWIAASDKRPLNKGTVNELHGGTAGGMWKWTGTVLAVIDAAPSSSTGRLIHSSYPNPFNPAATIEFSLPEAAHTSLRIYNSAGSEVATLIDRPLREGPHAVQWHAQGQASGVYFYRLQAKSAVVAGTMVLAK